MPPTWHAGTHSDKPRRIGADLNVEDKVISATVATSTSSRPPTSSSWLPVMTTGQSNIEMRLHGYWVIQYCTSFTAAANLRSCTTSTYCDESAGKHSAGGNISDYTVTNWTRCLEDIMRYHSHAWETKKKEVQSNLEETQPLNVPDRVTFLGGGGGVRQSLHR
jgi:hypothetical protein